VTPTDPPDDADVDPVLVRRAQIAGLVRVGKRLGYGLFLLAIVLFFVGLAVGFTEVYATAIVWAMVIGSLVLAPAIVFDYGVRAAVREEAQSED
jgi:hypothetical protein